MEILTISLPCEESSDSIQFIEKPQPAPPEVIDIEDDSIRLHITKPIVSTPVKSSISNKPLFETIKESSKSVTRPQSVSVGVSDEASPYHWTPDMKEFYNLEPDNDFTIARIRRKMPQNPKFWQVSPRDVIGRKSPKGIKCNNCHQYGHIARVCDKPVIIICHMCGAKGHRSKRCPLSQCLTCGRKTSSYTNMCGYCSTLRSSQCRRCMVIGHLPIDCTDHWRRFHGTISAGDITPSHERLNKSWDSLWCCNCASKGHDSFCCKEQRSEFPAAFPFVFSYDDCPLIKEIPIPRRQGHSKSSYEPERKKPRYFEIAEKVTNGHEAEKRNERAMSVQDNVQRKEKKKKKIAKKSDKYRRWRKNKRKRNASKKAEGNANL